MPPVIVLDSDDDDDVCIVGMPAGAARGEVIELDNSQPNTNGSRDTSLEEDPLPSSSTATPIKRIQPQLVSREVSAASSARKRPFGASPEAKRPQQNGRKPKTGSFKRNRLIRLSDGLGLSDDEEAEEEGNKISNATTTTIPNNHAEEEKADGPSSHSSPKAKKEKFTKEFRKLIVACRTADSSPDMEKLIRKKLIGYYLEVPPDFVASKSFCTLVAQVTEEIRKGPHLIYLKMTRIIEELKPRRYSSVKVEPLPSPSAEEAGSSAAAAPAAPLPHTEAGNSRKDQQIRKLNKALVKLKKRIDELDREEVDFDEDVNSAHMKVERYKKRACQIYERICDISGESKHAQRSTRKPIKFNGTAYAEFNKTLQAFVNRTNIFPDYFDVKKCLEHCNKQYDLKLRAEEIKALAQDAFVKVGKILQKRRKLDLYEMVSYFVGTDKDPADEDHDLQEKLGRNKQYHAKISDLIDKFATENDPNESIEDTLTAEMKFEPSPNPDLDAPGCSTSAKRDSTETPFEVKLEPEIEIIESAPMLNGESTPPGLESNGMVIADSECMDAAIEYIVSNNLDPFDAVPEVNSMLMMTATDDGFNFDL